MESCISNCFANTEGNYFDEHRRMLNCRYQCYHGGKNLKEEKSKEEKEEEKPIEEEKSESESESEFDCYDTCWTRIYNKEYNTGIDSELDIYKLKDIEIRCKKECSSASSFLAMW